MTTQQKTQSNINWDKVGDFILSFFRSFYYGIKEFKRFFKNDKIHKVSLFAGFNLFVFSFFYSRTLHFFAARHLNGWPSFKLHEYLVFDVNQFVLGFTGLALFYLTFIFFLGACYAHRKKKYQNNLNMLGIKNGNGDTPKVLDITPCTLGRDKILVQSPGIPKEKYTTDGAFNTMNMAFGGYIESIDEIVNKKQVEIFLNKKPLTKACNYESVKMELTDDDSFIVGQGHSGVVTQKIAELPHLLIAGTTGSGKSNCFRQVVMGLLDSPGRKRIYLLDLKNGVEAQIFKDFPNVYISKEIETAVSLLKDLKEVMDDRYKFLERNRRNQIDPLRDARDRIIILIDECSVLFDKTPANPQEADYTAQARSLVDSLAKLGRAAAINLVFATQKITKETLNTTVQENVEGRFAFAQKTLAGSLNVLGNKRALDIPKIKGRCIWNSFASYEEVQVPLISEKYILKRAEIEIENAKQREKFPTREEIHIRSMGRKEEAVIDGHKEVKQNGACDG